jgi:hypothetical protein
MDILYQKIAGTLAFWAVAAVLDALMDETNFHPTKAWLSIRWPAQFGPRNWEWLYVDPKAEPKVKRYSAIQEAALTPFKSGWHRLKLYKLYCYAAATAFAISLPFWWLCAALYVLWHQLVFTPLFASSLLEKKS